MFPSSLVLAVALAVLGLPLRAVMALAPDSSLIPRATICNGHAELCDRGYGAVTFVGAHNSYAVGTNDLAANQDLPITQQLNDGIRLLQSQAHNEGGVIKLCHTSCILYDGGTLEDYLRTVKTWLDANPNEVLSLLIVNIDNIAAADYDAVFKAVGLDTMSYAPPQSTLPATGWPTLGSMIDANTRLVTFLDNSADPSIPYLIDEFSNIWETAFNVVDANLFDCSVNRTRGDTTTQMFLINHFLDKLFLGNPVPDTDKLPQTNSGTGFGSVGSHVDACRAAHGRAPNFILLDYYEHGGAAPFQVAAGINGVPYNPSTPIAQPPSSTSPASGSQTGTASRTGTGSSVSITSQPLPGTGAGFRIAPGFEWAIILVGFIYGAWVL